MVMIKQYKIPFDMQGCFVRTGAVELGHTDYFPEKCLLNKKINF